MKEILIISTGGTFNKIYNKISGNLDIDYNNLALKNIEKNWLCRLNYINIINKDSLYFTQNDRELLLNTIKNSSYNKIVVIHGTDTVDISAEFIDRAKLNKAILFTGAMVPFSINPIEATANLAQSIGYIKLADNGVYLSMNGAIGNYKNIIKNRILGKFEYIKTN